MRRAIVFSLLVCGGGVTVATACAPGEGEAPGGWAGGNAEASVDRDGAAVYDAGLASQFDTSTPQAVVADASSAPQVPPSLPYCATQDAGAGADAGAPSCNALDPCAAQVVGQTSVHGLPRRSVDRSWQAHTRSSTCVSSTARRTVTAASGPGRFAGLAFGSAASPRFSSSATRRTRAQRSTRIHPPRNRRGRAEPTPSMAPRSSSILRARRVERRHGATPRRVTSCSGSWRINPPASPGRWSTVGSDVAGALTHRTDAIRAGAHQPPSTVAPFAICSQAP